MGYQGNNTGGSSTGRQTVQAPSNTGIVPNQPTVSSVGATSQTQTVDNICQETKQVLTPPQGGGSGPPTPPPKKQPRKITNEKLRSKHLRIISKDIFFDLFQGAKRFTDSSDVVRYPNYRYGLGNYNTVDEKKMTLQAATPEGKSRLVEDLVAPDTKLNYDVPTSLEKKALEDYNKFLKGNKYSYINFVLDVPFDMREALENELASGRPGAKLKYTGNDPRISTFEHEFVYNDHLKKYEELIKNSVKEEWSIPNSHTFSFLRESLTDADVGSFDQEYLDYISYDVNKPWLQGRLASAGFPYSRYLNEYLPSISSYVENYSQNFKDKAKNYVVTQDDIIEYSQFSEIYRGSLNYGFYLSIPYETPNVAGTLDQDLDVFKEVFRKTDTDQNLYDLVIRSEGDITEPKNLAARKVSKFSTREYITQLSYVEYGATGKKGAPLNFSLDNPSFKTWDLTEFFLDYKDQIGRALSNVLNVGKNKEVTILGQSNELIQKRVSNSTYNWWQKLLTDTANTSFKKLVDNNKIAPIQCFVESTETPHEILFYKIEKFDENRTSLQTFFIPSPVEEKKTKNLLINFFDSQVKYGKEYTYQVSVFPLVLAKKYEYSPWYEKRLIESPPLIWKLFFELMAALMKQFPNFIIKKRKALKRCNDPICKEYNRLRKKLKDCGVEGLDSKNPYFPKKLEKQYADTVRGLLGDSAGLGGGGTITAGGCVQIWQRFDDKGFERVSGATTKERYLYLRSQVEKINLLVDYPDVDDLVKQILSFIEGYNSSYIKRYRSQTAKDLIKRLLEKIYQDFVGLFSSSLSSIKNSEFERIINNGGSKRRLFEDIFDWIIRWYYGTGAKLSFFNYNNFTKLKGVKTTSTAMYKSLEKAFASVFRDKIESKSLNPKFLDPYSKIYLILAKDMQDLYDLESLPDSFNGFDIQVEDYIALMEIPIFSVTGQVLENPPVYPQIKFSGIKGKNNKVIIDMVNQNTRMYEKPIAISEEDEDRFQKIITTKGTDNQGRILFKTDDPNEKFEVFRSEERPSTYREFAGKLRRTIDLQGKYASATMQDSLIPNKKYYYTFRSVDTNENISNPSPVYEVIVNDYDGFILPEIRIIDLERRDYYEYTREFKKYMEIKPSLENLIIDPDVVENYSSADQLVKQDIPLGVSEDACWGRNFKIRLTSKNSGKKIDINFNFDKKHIPSTREKKEENIKKSGPTPQPRPIPVQPQGETPGPIIPGGLGLVPGGDTTGTGPSPGGVSSTPSRDPNPTGFLPPESGTDIVDPTRAAQGSPTSTTTGVQGTNSSEEPRLEPTLTDKELKIRR